MSTSADAATAASQPLGPDPAAVRRRSDTVIRRCVDGEIPAIINEAAQIYRGAIPEDCWHEPYISQTEVTTEIAAGVSFWGCGESGHLLGVMGLQRVRDVTLIHHAYVHPAHQGRGVGSALMAALRSQAERRLLVGTWAAAHWAIRFYERHGFRLVSPEEKDRLLRAYWRVPARQRDTSVVLVHAAIGEGAELRPDSNEP